MKPSVAILFALAVPLGLAATGCSSVVNGGGAGGAGSTSTGSGGADGHHLVKSIHALDISTCAVLIDGRVKCWGYNGDGELGLGDTLDRGDDPGEMGNHLPAVDLGPGRTARALSGGDYEACAILDDETLKCWGLNESGELGLGDTVNRGTKPGEMGAALPTVDLGTGRHVVQVSVGSGCSCAILDGGDLKCWSGNNFGQLGTDFGIDGIGSAPGQMGDNLPTVDLGTGRTAIAVATSGVHTCVILEDGSVKCWGKGNHNEVGGWSWGAMGDALALIDLGSGRTAIAVSVGYSSNVVDPAQGGGQTCVLLDDATVKCWGYNVWGQLGLGDTLDRFPDGDNLLPLDLGTGRHAVGISYPCALLDDGGVKCWGSISGDLGLGNTSSHGDKPGTMGDALPEIDLGAGRTATSISAGTYSVCANLDDGTTKCWGLNSAGELGQGDTMYRGNKPGEMGDSLLPIDL